ncbi:hypothetical protein, partial [Ureibacillus terrenus]|uniref:hypothetical protein n=1 Tax=Ureibacillus terrenus TaxID=118246 RepID=UPI002E1BD91E|nr:hypothetical protein [Ureibacillus terrenus]
PPIPFVSRGERHFVCLVTVELGSYIAKISDKLHIGIIKLDKNCDFQAFSYNRSLIAWNFAFAGAADTVHVFANSSVHNHLMSNIQLIK